jgi:hypothetical protein
VRGTTSCWLVETCLPCLRSSIPNSPSPITPATSTQLKSNYLLQTSPMGKLQDCHQNIIEELESTKTEKCKP